MYIQEFIQKYCRDLLHSNSVEKSMFGFNDDLEYDYIIYDVDGAPVRVIQVDNLEIPITDIIQLEKEDFLKYYSSPHAEEAYDNYLNSIDFLFGEEAVFYLRNQIKQATEKLKKECEMMQTWSDLNS